MKGYMKVFQKEEKNLLSWDNFGLYSWAIDKIEQMLFIVGWSFQFIKDESYWYIIIIKIWNNSSMFEHNKNKWIFWNSIYANDK